MPTVVRRGNESIDQLMRRFRKAVTRSRVLSQVRRKRWHISKSELRRIQDKKAARRNRQRDRS